MRLRDERHVGGRRGSRRPDRVGVLLRARVSTICSGVWCRPGVDHLHARVRGARAAMILAPRFVRRRGRAWPRRHGSSSVWRAPRTCAARSLGRRRASASVRMSARRVRAVDRGGGPCALELQAWRWPVLSRLELRSLAEQRLERRRALLACQSGPKRRRRPIVPALERSTVVAPAPSATRAQSIMPNLDAVASAGAWRVGRREQQRGRDAAASAATSSYGVQNRPFRQGRVSVVGRRRPSRGLSTISSLGGMYARAVEKVRHQVLLAAGRAAEGVERRAGRGVVAAGAERADPVDRLALDGLVDAEERIVRRRRRGEGVDADDDALAGVHSCSKR